MLQAGSMPAYSDFPKFGSSEISDFHKRQSFRFAENSGMDEIEWIREGLKKPGKTKSGLAQALGRAPSAVSALLKGERVLKAREIPKIEQYLEVKAPKELISEAVYSVLRSRNPDEAPARARGDDLEEPNVDLSKAEPVPANQRFGGPRDVPVYGTAVGGGDEDGDFRFNGEQIDMAPRPPGIANRKDVFCLYVENDSMFPKFEPGERLYVDPHRKPRQGEYVVVELHGESEGEPGKGYIKRLVKQTPTRLVVSQFNPPKELEFEADRVKRLLRVIPTDELLGV